MCMHMTLHTTSHLTWHNSVNNLYLRLLQRSASEKRKARRKVNQRFLTAMMDMGIPNEKAELALSETGNVGVEVATEWLFSVPDHVLEKHLASEPNTPVEAAQQNPEDTRVLLPRRVPLQVGRLARCLSHLLCFVSVHGQPESAQPCSTCEFKCSMSCWLPASPFSQSKRLADTDMHNELWFVVLPVAMCLPGVTGCTHDFSSSCTSVLARRLAWLGTGTDGRSGSAAYDSSPECKPAAQVFT